MTPECQENKRNIYIYIYIYRERERERERESIKSVEKFGYSFESVIIYQNTQGNPEKTMLNANNYANMLNCEAKLII